MSTAARHKSLILVSEDYDPQDWHAHDHSESEFQSWVAVAQDLWGLGCYGVGAAEALRDGANGLTVAKTQIVGAIGGAVGGAGAIASELHAHIDVFDCDGAVLEYKRQDRGVAGAGKLLKLASWDPAKPELQSNRYHSLLGLRALSFTAAPEQLLKVMIDAVKESGQLFIDELYVTDESVGALIAQSIAGPGQRLVLHKQSIAIEALNAAGLELRSTASANDELMAAIRDGLKRATHIARLLKTVPQPFRRQRMLAFTNELQRAAVLYQALDKGLVIAVRTIHRKPRKM